MWLVRSAAAQVAAHPLTDLLDGGLRRLSQQRLHRHHLSRSAVAALHRVLFHEGLLHGAELLAVHQALDGGDLGPHRFQGQRQARIPGYAVDQNGARSALAAFAPRFRPGEPQPVVQHMLQGPARFHAQGVSLAVDVEDGGHHVAVRGWRGCRLGRLRPGGSVWPLRLRRKPPNQKNACGSARPGLAVRSWVSSSGSPQHIIGPRSPEYKRGA